jgi:hypothetical protein
MSTARAAGAMSRQSCLKSARAGFFIRPPD